MILPVGKVQMETDRPIVPRGRPSFQEEFLLALARQEIKNERKEQKGGK